MIAAIKTLSPVQQRRLITLLEPRVDLLGIADEAALAELVPILRATLQVPRKDDLPEYMRRRLVDVARRHFELGENFDTTTDLRLAKLIVDFAFRAVAQLTDDDERRADFETFLRTKDRRERTRWLMESEHFATTMRNESLDFEAARERAHELYEGANAHRETAAAILRHLGATDRSSVPGWREIVMPAATQASAGAIAALTGSLYMAGRRKQELVKAPTADDAKGRAQRARNSKLVQGVVCLSAFLLIHAPEADE